MKQLKKVFKYYDLRCAKCGNKKFRLSLNSKVNIKCGACSWRLVCKRRLPEETGPQIASALSVGRNRGLWKHPKDTGMIGSTQDEDSERIEVRAPKKKSKVRFAESSPQCPFCGSTVMVLDKPREGEERTSSWRCSMPGCLGVVKQD